MGKHYPGEQLPRWAIHAHWRADGEPVWKNPSLLASDEDKGTARALDAARFAGALAERLQIDPDLVNQAYEDIHYYLWRKSACPPTSSRWNPNSATSWSAPASPASSAAA